MEKITELAKLLGNLLLNRKIKIVTAESCSGGGIAQAITSIPNSSSWFDIGFVTYSNHAKIQLLQVKQVTLNQYGAVSKEVAVEMANGALIKSGAYCAISVTGITGPTGGTKLKPIGTVYIACKITDQQVNCKKYNFSGDRKQIRLQTIEYGLQHGISELRLKKYASKNF